MSMPITCSPLTGHLVDRSLLATAAPQFLPAWASRVETDSDARHLAKRSELSPPLNAPWQLQLTSKQGLIWPDRIAQGSLNMTSPDRPLPASAREVRQAPVQRPCAAIPPMAKVRKQWQANSPQQVDALKQAISQQCDSTQYRNLADRVAILKQVILHNQPKLEQLARSEGARSTPTSLQWAAPFAKQPASNPVTRQIGGGRPPCVSQATPAKSETSVKTTAPTLTQALARANPVHNQKDQVLDLFLDALLRTTDDVASQYGHFGSARQNVALQGLLKNQIEDLTISQTQRVLVHLQNGLGTSAHAIAEHARQRLAQGTSDPSRQQHLSGLAQADHLADSLFKALNRKLKTPIADLRPSNALAGNLSRLSAADKQALVRLTARQPAPAG